MGSKNLLNENYKTINHIASKCLRIFAGLMVIFWVFAFISNDCNRVILSITMGGCIVLTFIPTLIIDILKIDSTSMTKYTVITLAVIICTVMNGVLSHMALLVWIFPLLVSSLYYNSTLVLYTSLISTVGVLAANAFTVFFSDITVKPIYSDLSECLIFLVFPCVLTIFIMSFVAYFIVGRNSSMLKNVMDKSRELKENQKELIFAFAEMSESKSKYTGEHIKRVADYMRILGEASGFDEEYVDNLSTAAMMHDIGKLMIPEEILDKPTRLTDEEFAIMKNHVLYGDALLKNCPGEMLQMARTIAREHHEKWDGTGYLHMQGEEIAYISRLMAVCDVFDALSSVRDYKQGWSFEETYDEIVGLSGKAFDPQVIKLFKENFSKFKKVLDSQPDRN
jgi:HD-GYP domain-containing protein (c-di-GMP phosphodiesterase class II)